MPTSMCKKNERTGVRSLPFVVLRQLRQDEESVSLSIRNDSARGEGYANRGDDWG